MRDDGGDAASPRDVAAIATASPRDGSLGLRVLVCGGRNFKSKGDLFDNLDFISRELVDKVPFTSVIHGDASGADTLAKEWAIARGIPPVPFPADWTKHGKAGGPIRNQQMLDEGKPDLVVAFPGGKGTADMVSRAHKAKVRVIRVKS